MSLESALEEERLEILRLLERPTTNARSHRNASSTASSPTLPRSPPLLPRTTSPSRGRSPSNGPPIPGISSMILAAEQPSHSSSPPSSKHNSRSRSRDASPTVHSPASQRLQSLLTPNADYQFGMIPSIPPSANVRRPNAGPSGKPLQSSSSPGTSPTLSHAHMSPGYQETLASIYSESGPFQPGGMGLPPGAEQHSSSIWKGVNASNRRSNSPFSHNRSSSPASAGLLSPLSPPPLVGGGVSSSTLPRHILTQNDVIVDLDHAYRRLSDEALARSGGSLSTLPARGGQSAHIRANSGESVTRDGGIRLEKDLTFAVGEDGREVAVESSDESVESSEEDSDLRHGRKGAGVNTSTKFEAIGAQIDGLDKLRHPFQKGAKGLESRDQPPRKTMSLLAAAEEERKSVSSRYHVSSLLTPSVMVSPPTLTQANTAKNYIHPNTNFDVASHTSTPISSDAEADAKDLKKAQRMALTMSPIMSTPETNRTVRSITRGDLNAVKQDPANLRRKQKTYLVATDLSGEAAHALEWTIGTVLRDGDTLLAIYAIDEEAGAENSTSGGKADGNFEDGSNTSRATSRTEQKQKMIDREVNSMLNLDTITEHVASQSNVLHSEPYSRSEAQGSVTASPSMSSEQIGALPSSSSTPALPTDDVQNEPAKARSKVEQERWNATESITALVTKLLRRTRLQINVVIEVIHCKSPKHLLTEMIDVLEPTLVILGSRGRSALKGVLLGSFSNYLVTKSSVPVMVARKKLKKTKYRKTNVRLTNNLTSSLGYRGIALADAKID